MSAAPQSLPTDTAAVVIGASAGGVEALLRVCGAFPADFAWPVLIVLHVAPGGPSTLAGLLDQHCALPVTEAMDKQPITPGTVVVAPADYHLLVESTNTLALSVDAPVHYSRPAIDPLFESAALHWRKRLLAILMTGASRDGTDGVAMIRRLGGQAWIQDPDEAYSPLMPAHALQHAGADAVLQLEQICSAIRQTAAPPTAAPTSIAPPNLSA